MFVFFFIEEHCFDHFFSFSFETFIQENCEFSRPNDGFMRQLAIFGSLNFHADAAALSKSSEYRRWCVETGNVPQNGTSF